MTSVAPTGLPPLAPAWKNQAMQGSLALFGSLNDVAVPPRAFALAPGAPASLVTKDWQEAAGFTAMAMTELLRPIFDTVHLSKSRFGGGAGEAAWKPILVQAIGHEMAENGGLGLTATVFQELLREQQGAGPAAKQSPQGQSGTEGGVG